MDETVLLGTMIIKMLLLFLKAKEETGQLTEDGNHGRLHSLLNSFLVPYYSINRPSPAGQGVRSIGLRFFSLI